MLRKTRAAHDALREETSTVCVVSKIITTKFHSNAPATHSSISVQSGFKKDPDIAVKATPIQPGKAHQPVWCSPALTAEYRTPHILLQSLHREVTYDDPIQQSSCSIPSLAPRAHYIATPHAGRDPCFIASLTAPPPPPPAPAPAPAAPPGSTPPDSPRTPPCPAAAASQLQHQHQHQHQ